MRSRQLLRRLDSGQLANVRFADLRRLLEALGFRLDRVTGSHHLYVHDGFGLTLNLQEDRRQAKPYQLRQLKRMLDRYDLVPEDLR
jgi:predicted RNA binding protein YcfA (HicA-like mRNA interferase family)